ncbi:MAG: hypothetical protein FWE91_11555 [Defluviitaleaceae bacterium]|nr:hypothetical protein [Defluviitaleaceae bacterium]MCL2836213.1 hypothetical protein [Defluviitaleaceae bacterium]
MAERILAEDILHETENVELSLPVNAAYISAAKQTAFSVAGRMGFDAQEQHDIKTAVSEACAYLIKGLAGGAAKAYTITFRLTGGHISISMSCPSGDITSFTDGDNNLQKIRYLVDHFEILNNGSVFEIAMSKNHNE